MSRRTTFTRLGIGAAGAALATLAASAAPALAAPAGTGTSGPATHRTAPAQAADGWGDEGGTGGEDQGGSGQGDEGGSNWNGQEGSGQGEGEGSNWSDQGGSGGDGSNARQDHHQRLSKGRVTARSGLLLRDAPTRGSRVIRTAPFNSVVSIFCKASGGDVQGNHLWYLLTDGTWAWGSARYIDTIGQPPRWC